MYIVIIAFADTTFHAITNVVSSLSFSESTQQPIAQSSLISSRQFIVSGCTSSFSVTFTIAFANTSSHAVANIICSFSVSKST